MHVKLVCLMHEIQIDLNGALHDLSARPASSWIFRAGTQNLLDFDSQSLKQQFKSLNY